MSRKGQKSVKSKKKGTNWESYARIQGMKCPKCFNPLRRVSSTEDSVWFTCPLGHRFHSETGSGISDSEGQCLKEIYDFNPLLFDFILKRTMKIPGASKSLPASVFMAVTLSQLRTGCNASQKDYVRTAAGLVLKVSGVPGRPPGTASGCSMSSRPPLG